MLHQAVSWLSNPSWLRQKATLHESGSARGFFLLKGRFFMFMAMHLAGTFIQSNLQMRI